MCKNRLDTARFILNKRYSKQKACVNTRGMREPGVREPGVLESRWLQTAQCGWRGMGKDGKACSGSGRRASDLWSKC